VRYVVPPEPLDTSSIQRDAVTADIQRGVLKALEEHARNGTSVVVWRDGEIVELAGEALEQDIARVRREVEL
jgi:hypothetical protein